MAPSSQNGSDSNRSTWRMIGEYSGLAVTLPGAVVIGYLIGYLVDRSFHTGRIFTLVFLFLGGIAGLIEIVRVASRWQNRDQESGPQEPPHQEQHRQAPFHEPPHDRSKRS